MENANMEKHEKNQKLPNQKQAKNGSAAEPKSALFTEDRLQRKRVWMEKPNPDTTPTLLKAEHTHTPTLQCKEGGHRYGHGNIFFETRNIPITRILLFFRFRKSVNFLVSMIAQSWTLKSCIFLYYFSFLFFLL